MEIKGKIIRGDGYGKKIGFPTVNLSRTGYKKNIKFGVYVGRVTLSGKPRSRASSLRGREYKAGIVIGPLDTRNRAKGRASLPKIEAHLIGYTGNAYGKTATFEIKKFIRKFKKFKSEKELIAQIRKDLRKC